MPDFIKHQGKKLLLSFGILLCSLVSMANEKTDTVYLHNGDRITGEIKRLEYGILFLKASGLGTLQIEYDRIKTFYSNKQFTIQVSNGLRFFGSIDTSATAGSVNLVVRSFRIPEPISAIVEVYPVKNAFWKRLDGSIDLGYSYTKASTISQANFSGNVSYRVQKSFSEIDFSSIFTDQQDKDRIRKQDYNASFSRFFKKKWFGVGFLGVQQNTELGNNFRLFGGLGVGNDLVHNNLQVLSGSLGLMVSTEQSAEDSIVQSLEGIMQWKYRIFKFSKPDVELTSSFNVFPSLTSLGRVRMDFELKGKIEIFNDFYFGVTFYDNFDNQPLDNTAATNDWGVTTSVGYSW